MSDETPVCYVCGTEKDLRPYGINGQPICCDCASSDPERSAEADRQMNALLDKLGDKVVLSRTRGFISEDDIRDQPGHTAYLNLQTREIIEPKPE